MVGIPASGPDRSGLSGRRSPAALGRSQAAEWQLETVPDEEVKRSEADG